MHTPEERHASQEHVPTSHTGAYPPGPQGTQVIMVERDDGRDKRDDDAGCAGGVMAGCGERRGRGCVWGGRGEDAQGVERRSAMERVCMFDRANCEV